jgi:cytochrome c oxidase assembly factor CtaG
VIRNEWRVDPAVLAGAGIALALYAQAWLRLRRRDRRSHPLLFAAGVVIGVLAVVSPLDAVAEDQLLSAHMAQHLLLGDIAPLMIVLGLRGPVAFFLLPPPALRPLARAAPVRRVAAALLRPEIALAVWAASLAAWHVPQAYDAALAHPALHALEHATLFAGGILLWTQIIDPARRGHLGAGRRAALAALALVAGAGLSETLLAAGPLYDHYANVTDRPFGLTQATDQSRAALLMMAEQLATLGVAAALLVRSHLETVSGGLATTKTARGG